MVAPTQSNVWANPFGNNISSIVWSGLGNEAGDPIKGPGWTDRSAQIDGTFSGATVVIEGSNDGVTYFTLHDPLGNLVSTAVAAIFQILEVTAFIRPRVSGGDAPDVDVTLLVLRHK